MVELSENFNPIRQEGLMERANVTTEYCCGVDLHARTMYVTVVNRAGEVLVRQNMPNHFGKFVRVLEPFLPSVSVGVESTGIGWQTGATKPISRSTWDTLFT